ncbi:MAG TPA: serine protease [Dyella sp.]|uniref:S1 family peptidase n=1 Tax=Dyella sp. TaxID=1869338 RepID=UPI002F95C8C1
MGGIALASPLVASAGDAPIKPQIIGGMPAPTGAYPFMASIQLIRGETYEHFCGGVLVSDRHVLSAAHCYGNPDPSGMRIVLNRTNLSDELSGQVRGIAKGTIHPLYGTSLDHGYDLVILELDEPVEGIEPVELAPRGVLVDNVQVRTLGWGMTVDGEYDSGTEYLQMIDLPHVNAVTCKAIHSQFEWHPVTVNVKTDMCAGGEPGRSACHGDSGGPLLVKLWGSDKFLLAGLTSRGRSLTCSDAPGIFTSVMSDELWNTMY